MELEAVKKEIESTENQVKQLEKEWSEVLERGEISEAIPYKIEKSRQRLKNLQELEAVLQRKREDEQKAQRVKELEVEMAELRKQNLAVMEFIAEKRDEIKKPYDELKNLNLKFRNAKKEYASLKGMNESEISDLPYFSQITGSMAQIDGFLRLRVPGLER